MIVDDIRKSSRSRTLVPAPSGVKDVNVLYPRIHGRARIISRNMLMSTALRLVQPWLSIQYEMMFSNTAISVVMAANAMKRKNSVPHILPPSMDENTLGNVMNKRLGPEPGLIENEKHAGKIMRPENSATKVSSEMILTDSPVSDCSLPMYEPKISMEPIPSPSVKKAWLMAANIASDIPASFILLKSGMR